MFLYIALIYLTHFLVGIRQDLCKTKTKYGRIDQREGPYFLDFFFSVSVQIAIGSMGCYWVTENTDDVFSMLHNYGSKSHCY